MTNQTQTTRGELAIKPFGLHSKLYERPNPNGPGRQVVKESMTLSEIGKKQIYPDHSRIAIRNEYHAIQYVRQHTTIPVPNIVEFVDVPDTPVRIVMEYVENALPWKALRMPKDAQVRMVKQLESFVYQLHSLTDPDCRSFAGFPLFGLRFEDTHIPVQDFKYRRYDSNSPYVLVHGDLAWHNLLFDPITFEIKCVMDWEYAGFYPVEVESEYWRREGVVGGISEGEECDIDGVLATLWRHREEERNDIPIKNIDVGLDGPEYRLRKLLYEVSLGQDMTPTVGTLLGGGLDLGRRRFAGGIREASHFLTTGKTLLDEIFTEVINNQNGNPKHKLPFVSHGELFYLRIFPS
jgi:hypothetical protein